MVESLYLYSVLVNFGSLLKFFIVFALIVLLISFMVHVEDRSIRQSGTALRILKISGALFLAFSIILSLIPNDNILGLMLIAPYIEDNREVIQALPREIADFVIELIKEWKK